MVWSINSWIVKRIVFKYIQHHKFIFVKQTKKKEHLSLCDKLDKVSKWTSTTKCSTWPTFEWAMFPCFPPTESSFTIMSAYEITKHWSHEVLKCHHKTWKYLDSPMWDDTWQGQLVVYFTCMHSMPIAHTTCLIK